MNQSTYVPYKVQKSDDHGSGENKHERYKNSEELTLEEKYTIHFLEKELEKDNKEHHLDNAQRGVIITEILRIKEKNVFKEKKEEARDIQVHTKINEVEKDNHEIKKIQKELMEGKLSAQEKSQHLARLKELREDEIPIDKEEFKIVIKDIIDQVKHPGLKKFIIEHCVLDIDKKATHDIEVDPSSLSGKFLITFGPKGLFEEGKTTINDEFGLVKKFKFLEPGRGAYLLGQALGYIFVEPKDWKKVAPNVQFTEGGEVGSWEDFVGLCVSNPSDAEETFPDGYKFFRELLEGVGSNQANINKNQAKKGINLPKFAFNLEEGQEISQGRKTGFWGMIDWFDNMRSIVPRLREILWKKTDYYQRAVAEFEDKEVSKIMLRNPNIIERDQEFRQFIGEYSGGDLTDQFHVRAILLASMKFSDWSSYRMHWYLQGFDPFYKKTHGEEITEDSFCFLMRLHRMSNVARRMGTKPMEYGKVLPGQEYSTYDADKKTYVKKKAISTVYVRKTLDSFQEEVLDEIGTFTNRELSTTSKEVFEYMMVKDKFIDIDETWDGETRYDYPCGDMRQNLRSGFVDASFKNMNHRGGIPKLDVDQIATMARIIAEEFIVEVGDKPGVDLGIKTKTIVMAEHGKDIARRAYFFYRDRFLKNEKYRGYVNRYLGNYGLELNADGSYRHVEKTSNSDEDRLNNFINKEKTRIKDPDKDYDTSHKILDEFEEFDQDEKPDWKKNSDGEFEDKSANDLKAKFFLERDESDSARDLGIIKKSFDSYVDIIKKTISDNSKLANIIKEGVQDIALSSNDAFIGEEIDQMALARDQDAFLDRDKRYEIANGINDVVNKIRPYRRELIRLKKFLSNLGIEYHGKDYEKYPEYYNEIPAERDFEKDKDNKKDSRIKKIVTARKKSLQDEKINQNLTQEEKEEYLRLTKELDELKQEEKQIKAKPKSKEKSAEHKENLDNQKLVITQLEPLKDKIGEIIGGINDLGILQDLNLNASYLLKEVNDYSAGKVEELTEPIKESDNEEIIKRKSVFSLIPETIIKEAKIPEKFKYDTKRLQIALKMAKVFLEEQIKNSLESKITKPTKPKAKTPAQKEADEYESE